MEIVVQIHNFTHKQQQVAVVLLVNQVVLEPAMVAQALLVKGFLVELVVQMMGPQVHLLVVEVQVR